MLSSTAFSILKYASPNGIPVSASTFVIVNFGFDLFVIVAEFSLINEFGINVGYL